MGRNLGMALKEATPQKDGPIELVPDDKIGRVLWKDIEKITGGDFAVSPTKLDLSNFGKLPSLGPAKNYEGPDPEEKDADDLLGITQEGPRKMEFLIE